MAGIEITHGPENVSVLVNGSATFPCQFRGTTGQPFWYIRGNQYSLENLPPRHLFLHGNVTIYNVQPSDKGSTYQCTFFTVWSGIATLTVIAPETTTTPTIEVTATRVSQVHSSNSVQQHFSAGMLKSLLWLVLVMRLNACSFQLHDCYSLQSFVTYSSNKYYTNGKTQAKYLLYTW